MSYKFLPPAADGRGKGRGRGHPPRSGKYKGGAPIKSAQGVYPIIPDEDTTFAFVEFIHNRGSAILQAAGGPGAPQVYPSLMEGARNHPARTGSPSGIFRPDSMSSAPGKAKHFFPCFTIRFLKDHQFVNTAGVLETLTPGDFQG